MEKKIETDRERESQGELCCQVEGDEIEIIIQCHIKSCKWLALDRETKDK